MWFSLCTGGTRKIAMNIFDIILEMWKFERHSIRVSSETSLPGCVTIEKLLILFTEKLSQFILALNAELCTIDRPSQWTPVYSKGGRHIRLVYI